MGAISSSPAIRVDLTGHEEWANHLNDHDSANYIRTLPTTQWAALAEPKGNLETQLQVQQDHPPTQEEVNLAVKQMKKGKAPGPDNVTNEELKTEEAERNLHGLFREIWNEKRIPAEWKKCFLIPLRKTPGKMSTTNVRGVSLLSSTSKLLTRIILNRNPQPPTHNAQIGFRKARSTTHAIAAVNHLIKQSHDRGDGFPGDVGLRPIRW